MVMKILFILFYILTIISCNQETLKNNKKLDTTLIDLRITDDMNILGNWTMCSEYGNGSMIQYNVCPIISFTFDGTGSVSKSSIITDNFKWKFNNRVLTIYDNKDTNSTFPDNAYFAIITKQKNNLDLVIQQQKNDYSFHLSK
jgi:hypothetical protein